MDPITLSLSGEEIAFRIPDLLDLAELDSQFPTLPEDAELESVEGDTQAAEAAYRRIADDPKRLRRVLERIDRLLVLCALRPVLVAGYALEPAGDGKRYVRSYRGADRFMAGLELLGRAGYNQEAAVEIRPFSADGRSATSTPSAGDTDAPRASSPSDTSAATSPAGNESPSTSPATGSAT